MAFQNINRVTQYIHIHINQKVTSADATGTEMLTSSIHKNTIVATRRTKTTGQCPWLDCTPIRHHSNMKIAFPIRFTLNRMLIFRR